MGINTRQSVIEVQTIMHVDTMENEASGFSLTASDNGAPIVHRTNTLYTDIPMYLQLIQHIRTLKSEKLMNSLQYLHYV